MPTAWNVTRTETHYRHAVFSAGLRAAGYTVRSDAPQGAPGNVLLQWNRYGTYHETAKRFEAAGGTVLVAENGYVRGPKDGGDYYALARHAHNGAGTWAEGGPERWNALGIDLKPWREDGGHIIVCPNRTFGMPGFAMSPDWPSDVKRRLSKMTGREIRMRPHPGNDAPKKPLAEDLAGAWAMVIWASSAGVHALVAGIPVICESPYWVAKEATLPLEAYGAAIDHEKAFGTDGHTMTRRHAMERLAWAQFNLQEIESGFAFASLLRGKVESEIAGSS